jgi:uncharacterized pyridoxal phosphate-containing UPF0001 family protein
MSTAAPPRPASHQTRRWLLAREVAALPRLTLRGIMTIPEPSPDVATQLAVHQRARALFDDLCTAGLALDTLSMGMTADLEAAVQAGSTMVRVGTAILAAAPAPPDLCLFFRREFFTSSITA